MSKKELTTIEDLLSGHKTDEIELSTGKRFEIQSFMPGNLLIEIGSPLIEMMTDCDESSLRRMALDVPGTAAGIAWSRLEQVVCENVTNIRFSPESQNILPIGIVSLKRLTLGEIRELYIGIRDLSITPEELATFRESFQNPEESEQSKLAAEDSEDSGEESE